MRRADTLCRSLRELERCGINIVACSQIYLHAPHAGAGLMPAFYNALSRYAPTASGSLLRLLRASNGGRGDASGPRWSRRPLDLDVIDHGGRILNWPASPARRPVVLPHPLMHRRGFVLVPLADIAPHWRHPVLGVSAVGPPEAHAGAAARRYVNQLSQCCAAPGRIDQSRPGAATGRPRHRGGLIQNANRGMYGP